MEAFGRPRSGAAYLGVGFRGRKQGLRATAEAFGAARRRLEPALRLEERYREGELQPETLSLQLNAC